MRLSAGNAGLGPAAAPFALLAVLAVVMAVAGCAAPAPDPHTLVVALDSTPRTLDPRFAGGANAVHVLQLVCNALYRVDATGQPVPDLAREGAYVAPGRFRVVLRDDVRFQDGSPLVARDVVATFRSVLDPETGAIARGDLEVITSVRAEGDRAIVFELRAPFAPLLYKLAGVMILRAEHVASAGGETIDRPVGTGPFRLVEFERGRRVVLERHDEFFGGAAALRELRLRVLPNSATRLLELLKGSVHLVVNGIPPYALAAIERRPGLRVLHGPGASTTYLGLNLEHPILARPEVRRAIAHAIDRRRIVDTLLRGRAQLAAALLPPGHAARPDFGDGVAYDPARARALLDAAGFPDPPGDAPRFKLSYKTSTDRLRKQIGEVIAYQLAEVGIEFETRSLEWGTFYGDIQRGSFQTYTLKWVGLGDPDIFHYVFHSRSVPPRGANRGHFHDAEIDEWIDRSRAELDPEARLALYRRIERALAAQLPYVFLWHEDDTAVMSSRLDGFRLEPGGSLRSLGTAKLREAGA